MCWRSDRGKIRNVVSICASCDTVSYGHMKRYQSVHASPFGCCILMVSLKSWNSESSPTFCILFLGVHLLQMNSGEPLTFLKDHGRPAKNWVKSSCTAHLGQIWLPEYFCLIPPWISVTSAKPKCSLRVRVCIISWSETKLNQWACTMMVGSIRFLDYVFYFYQFCYSGEMEQTYLDRRI